MLATHVAQGANATVSNMEQSILQGTLQGSAILVGEKHNNTDSA